MILLRSPEGPLPVGSYSLLGIPFFDVPLLCRDLLWDSVDTFRPKPVTLRPTLSLSQISYIHSMFLTGIVSRPVLSFLYHSWVHG